MEERSTEVLIKRDGLIDSFRVDHLNVYLYASHLQVGVAAAETVASEIRRLISMRGRAGGIFASAPSQNEFLAALAEAPGIRWTRVIGFHLGEYLGMDEHAPQSSRRFLIDRLVSQVPMAEFHSLRGEAANPQAACANYAALLAAIRPDFAVLGIGEGGHLAFIGPPCCDFDDPSPVKVVELDEVWRQGQVSDGTFATLDEVPRRALSPTVPTIMACPRLFAIVTGPTRQRAVRETLKGPVTTACPASVLRGHPDAHLFLDRESAGLVTN